MRAVAGLIASQWERAIGSLSDLPTHTFELLHKRSDFLKHVLLFGQILRVQRTHLGQNGIEFSAIFTGKLPLECGGDVVPCCLRIQVLGRYKLLRLMLLLRLGKAEEGVNHTGLVTQLVQIGLVGRCVAVLFFVRCLSS